MNQPTLRMSPDHCETSASPVSPLKTVMLVDDEPLVLETVSLLLRQGVGVKVESFLSPERALEAFRARPEHYSLIITDYQMTGLNGIELARAIFAIRKTVALIMISGSAVGGWNPATEIGSPCQFLAKPFSYAQLLEAVTKAGIRS